MAEAKLNRDYALRLLGVGAMMTGMCVWSLYDGVAGWPRKNRELERARPALLATNLTAEAWIAQEEGELSPLAEVFRQTGAAAPSKLIKKLDELRLPKSSENLAALREAQARNIRLLIEKPLYSAHDLQAQFIQAGVTLALGLLAFAAVGVKARRRFVADEAGLRGSGFGGQAVAYSEIAAADWSRWDEKGIVTLRFKSGRRCKLDGWHFAGMTGIVDEIRRARPDLAGAARRNESSGSKG